MNVCLSVCLTFECLSESPEGLIKSQIAELSATASEFLIQYIPCEAQEFSFLTSSQGMSMLLTQELTLGAPALCHEINWLMELSLIFLP